MVSPGSHVVSGGHNVLATSTTSNGTRNGTIARAIRSKEILAMFETTYSTTPTGGVTVQIIRLSTKISPKCTGTLPSLLVILSRIGIIISVAAIYTINKIKTSNNTVTIAK